MLLTGTNFLHWLVAWRSW